MKPHFKCSTFRYIVQPLSGLLYYLSLRLFPPSFTGGYCIPPVSLEVIISLQFHWRLLYPSSFTGGYYGSSPFGLLGVKIYPGYADPEGV